MVFSSGRSIKGLLAAAALGIAAMAMPTSANATLAIYLQEASTNGGALTLVASGADFDSAVYNGTYGGFKLTISSASSDNGVTLSDLLGSTNRVENTNASAGTLKIFITQNNYTLPAGTPLIIESSQGGSVATGTLSGTNIFQAFAASSNVAGDTSDFTNGPQSATFTGSSFDTGSVSGLFARSSNKYSLTSCTTITLSAGGRINYSNQINATATVPEPSTMAIAGLGALGLIGYGIRRRRIG